MEQIRYFQRSRSSETKLTTSDLVAAKREGKRLVMVSITEVLTDTWAESAGVDIVGVGDCLGMTLHGRDNTLVMTFDQMIMQTQSVRPGGQIRFALPRCRAGHTAHP